MYNKIYVLWKVKRTCNLELTKCFLFAGKTIYYALNLKKKERLALLTFCVLPISLSKISPHRSYPSRAAASCARYCRPPRCAPHLALRGSAPKSSARIHLTPRPFIAAPCSISRRARSSSLHVVPPLLRTVTRPPRTLRCCHSPPEGRARYRRHGRCDARPQQWDVAMNCMLQAFQRYVAIVLYGYCKSRSGMLHMLHML
jgi:hypothetical protein